MRLPSFALFGLVASTVAAPQTPTTTTTTPTSTVVDSSTHTPDLAEPVASDNTVVDAFFQCLWPLTDRIVVELQGLSDLSFNKLIDEVHWEVLWWGAPDKWVPDLVGIGINATLVAGCLLEVAGESTGYTTEDVLNEFLKTLELIPRNASNTAVPGL